MKSKELHHFYMTFELIWWSTLTLLYVSFNQESFSVDFLECSLSLYKKIQYGDMGFYLDHPLLTFINIIEIMNFLWGRWLRFSIHFINQDSVSDVVRELWRGWTQSCATTRTQCSSTVIAIFEARWVDSFSEVSALRNSVSDYYEEKILVVKLQNDWDRGNPLHTLTEPFKPPFRPQL